MGRSLHAAAHDLHSTGGTSEPLETLLADGVELQRLGRNDEALAVFGRCLEVAPAHPSAQLLAAASNLRIGQWERGVAHARVAAAAAPGSATAWCNIAIGLRELRRGREAAHAARKALDLDPRLAEAWNTLGLVALDSESLDTARAHFLRALEIDPRLAWAHVSLAKLDQSLGRIDAALESYRNAQAIDPTLAEIPFGRGNLYSRTGRFDAAITAFQETIALRADHPFAHRNLSQVLLLTGDFAGFWDQSRWRPSRLDYEARLKTLGRAYEIPSPSKLAGARLLVIGEEGVGDTIFLLRYAPWIRALGVRLDFCGDARLHAMLSRTGLFERLGVSDDEMREDGVHEMLAGDLVLLLPEARRGEVPPPLVLVPDAARVAAIRARLSPLGPAPCVALAWRAGAVRTGVFNSLFKELPLSALGTALKGKRATWISVQREPRAGETETLARHLGGKVHDFSAINEDLEEALALMAVIDDFVGVSNTNVHLLAGCGGHANMLVPFPYQGRWMAQGTSPWFPTMRVYRQAIDGSWDEAFAQLSREIGS